MNKKLLLAGLILCACSFAQNVQRTQLANTVSSTSTTQVYVYSTVIPASLSHGYIYIDSEAMQVTQSAFSPSALNNLVLLTVTRGILGTNAATHAAGAVAFFGNPGQFISADLSGGCNSAGPQYLNVSDQMLFSCGPTGLWVGITTSLSGGGGSSYVLPIATTSVLGGIKPDGTTIGVNSSTGIASVTGSYLATPGTNNVIVKYTSATSTLPALFADIAALITGTPSSTTYLNGLGAWTIPPGSGGFYQTFQANGTPSSQQATFNAVAGTNMTITPTTVGSVTTFTFASSGGGSSPLTTKGDVYGFSTVAARVPVGTDTFVLTADSTQALGVKWAAVGSATNSWTSGSGVPTANCTPGTGNYLYYDIALTNPGMPIYYCSATNVWTQGVNLGGSGCLAFTAGTLDIVTACIPQKSAANTFGANQTEGLGAKWSNTHGTVTQTSGWAALSGGTSGAIATSSIAALGTPTTAGDWVQMANMNCTGILNYSIVATTSITITDTVSESCSVHWEIKHDQ